MSDRDLTFVGVLVVIVMALAHRLGAGMLTNFLLGYFVGTTAMGATYVWHAFRTRPGQEPQR